MLNPEDRRAIEGLFDRLAEVERRTPERDAEAEQLIRAQVGRQPGAPYYMAQTILVQEQALEMAERRIRELEQQASQRDRGGFFGGLFDDGRGRQNRNDVQPSRGGPWDRAQDPRDAAYRDQGYGVGQGRGGGFLAGAAQTALGVAGGVLIGNAIGAMFGAGAAHAGEMQSGDQQGNDSGSNTGNDASGDAGGGQDNGFDDGGFGGGDDGFDVGGDF